MFCKKIEGWPCQTSFDTERSPMGVFSRTTKLRPEERWRGKMKKEVEERKGKRRSKDVIWWACEHEQGSRTKSF
jgi:hypothetical protein